MHFLRNLLKTYNSTIHFIEISLKQKKVLDLTKNIFQNLINIYVKLIIHPRIRDT
jgi:hypothetical protein